MGMAEKEIHKGFWLLEVPGTELILHEANSRRIGFNRVRILHDDKMFTFR
jgi:hypothetical protein